MSQYMCEELKPCHRKCNDKLVMVRGEAPNMWWIRCQGCRACGRCCETREEAISAWNEGKEKIDAMNEKTPNAPGVNPIETIKQLESQLATANEENERLRGELKIARCPCGGWLEGVGIEIRTQTYIYQCDKCGVQLETPRKIVLGVPPCGTT